MTALSTDSLLPSEYTAAKPYLKWAGGKTQLIPEIEALIPYAHSDAFTYVEPFIGSGAISFWMRSNFPNIHKAVINDANQELVCTYRALKEAPDDVIALLEGLQDDYWSLEGNPDNKKAYYYERRQEFNQKPKDTVRLAALLIFLNRTCFNGLYRVNRKNEFNVPIGSYKQPRILDDQNLRSVSRVLASTKVLCGDYEDTIKYADKNTLFYFDPPYKPLSETSSFNSYAKDAFEDDEQVRLKEYCDKLDQIGCKWILSNSDVRQHDEETSFFDQLYSNYQIKRVKAKRAINSKASKRGELNELLITNF